MILKILVQEPTLKEAIVKNILCNFTICANTGWLADDHDYEIDTVDIIDALRLHTDLVFRKTLWKLFLNNFLNKNSAEDRQEVECLILFLLSSDSDDEILEIFEHLFIIFNEFSNDRIKRFIKNTNLYSFVWF